jgi:protein-S-isoprenylcysteine O-methyltransferase Ste14
MLNQYLILAFSWIAFCILHSILASLWFKKKIETNIGLSMKWYRPFYVLFAFISFGAVLFYQFSLSSVVIYKMNYVTIISGGTIALAGLVIMIICIVKYFSLLSGLRNLFYNEPNNKLMKDGLHRIVRHPLYFGTFVFIWGLFIVLPYLSLLICNLVVTIYTLIGIRFEEAKLEKEFGESYKQYKARVPMIIPAL